MTTKHPTLLASLDALIEPLAGSSEAVLRWTCQSTRTLAQELSQSERQVSERTIAALLRESGYQLRAVGGRNSRAAEPGLGEQMAKLQARIAAYHQQRIPVIAVDVCVRRTNGPLAAIGDVERNQIPHLEAGGCAALDPALSEFFPNGIVVNDRRNWRSAAIDRDTAAFAAASIRRWWQEVSSPEFSDAKRLLIIGDRDDFTDAWQTTLCGLAAGLDLTLEVWPLPRVTSRWNRPGSYFLSFTKKVWRGEPMLHRQVIVQTIRCIEEDPLHFRAVLDSAPYPSQSNAASDAFAASRRGFQNAEGVWVIGPKSGQKF